MRRWKSDSLVVLGARKAVCMGKQRGGAFHRSRNSEQSPIPVREHGSIQPAFRLRTSGSNSLHHTVSADVKLAVVGISRNKAVTPVF
jgi:hypothetical protein